MSDQTAPKRSLPIPVHQAATPSASAPSAAPALVAPVPPVKPEHYMKGPFSRLDEAFEKPAAPGFWGKVAKVGDILYNMMPEQAGLNAAFDGVEDMIYDKENRAYEKELAEYEAAQALAAEAAATRVEAEAEPPSSPNGGSAEQTLAQRFPELYGEGGSSAAGLAAARSRDSALSNSGGMEL